MGETWQDYFKSLADESRMIYVEGGEYDVLGAGPEYVSLRTTIQGQTFTVRLPYRAIGSVITDDSLKTVMVATLSGDIAKSIKRHKEL